MEALQAVGENGQDEQSKQDSEGVYRSEIRYRTSAVFLPSLSSFIAESMCSSVRIEPAKLLFLMRFGFVLATL